MESLSPLLIPDLVLALRSDFGGGDWPDTLLPLQGKSQLAMRRRRRPTKCSGTDTVFDRRPFEDGGADHFRRRQPGATVRTSFIDPGEAAAG
jgi:hypothetical protein